MTTTSGCALEELAATVEALTGPDREVDTAIFDLCDPRASERNGRGLLPWAHLYTASLDAAMTLVPEGWVVGEMSWWPDSQLSTCHMDNRKGLTGCSGAKALPLSLTAAALRARARQATSAAIGGDPQPRDPSSYEKEPS